VNAHDIVKKKSTAPFARACSGNALLERIGRKFGSRAKKKLDTLRALKVNDSFFFSIWRRFDLDIAINVWNMAIVYRIDVRDKREAAGEMHFLRKFPSTLSGLVVPRGRVLARSRLSSRLFVRVRIKNGLPRIRWRPLDGIPPPVKFS